MNSKKTQLFDSALVRQSIIDAVKKCAPQAQWRNPVMFVVYIGSIITTLLWLAMLANYAEGNAWFSGMITLWLWFTVLFANFAEALAEGRSKAQAASLKGVKKRSSAIRLAEANLDSAQETVNSD